MAVVLSVAFVFSFIAVPSQGQTGGQTTQEQIDFYLQEIAKLQTQLNIGSSTTTVVSSSSSVCPYAWSRNLTIGSTGEDVRQLQRFLNSEGLGVATTGAGSPGSESTYYGSRTAGAVTNFQEKYASSILTPLGLSTGTGGFYNSTRTQANALCATSPTPTAGAGTYVPVVDTSSAIRSTDPTVSTGSLEVTASPAQPPNGFAVAGAQRVPFTNFVINARGGDVRVTGVTVERFGLIDDDALDNIYIIDPSGQKVTNERGLNTDSIARISGSFVVRSGSPASLVVVADIVDSDTAEAQGINLNGSGGLKIIEVQTDAGNLKPQISGATHTLSDSVELGSLNIDFDAVAAPVPGSPNSIEISDDVIEFFDADFEAQGNEDIRLYSITFEQKGSVSFQDFESLELLVERDSYQPSVNGDDYTFVFSSEGILIEENEEVDVTLEGVLQGGVDRSIEFVIEEPSDVYAIGDDFQYGVQVTSDGSSFTADISTERFDDITGGDVEFTRGSFLSSDDLDLLDGANDQTLGGFELDIEGETYAIQGIEIELTLAGLPTNPPLDLNTLDGDGLEINSIVLEVDGSVLGYSDDDIEFTETIKTRTITFDDTIDFAPGEYEVVIKGDLDDEYPDGATIQATIKSVDEVEGYTSGDDVASTVNGNLSSGLALRRASVDGDLLDISFLALANNSIVADTDNVVFAEIRVNADDSSRDVYLDELRLQARPGSNSNLSDVDNCRLEADGVEVADTSSSLSGTGNDDNVDFEFKGGSRGYTLEAGQSETFEVVCDVSNADDTDSFSFNTIATSFLKYELEDLGDQTFDFGVNDGPIITVTDGGTLTASYDAESTFLVATGRNGSDFVKIGDITFDAEDEDIEVNDIQFEVVAPTTNIDSAIDEVRIEVDGVVVGRETVTSSPFTVEDLDTIVESDNSETFDIYVSLEGIDDDRTGTSGNRIELQVDTITYTGDSSNEDGTITANEDLGAVYTYRSLPEFSADPTTQTLKNGRQQILYEFDVAANSEGPASISTLTFSITNNGVTIDGAPEPWLLYAFTNSGRTNGVSEGNDDGVIGSSADGTTATIDFTEPVDIEAGEVVYFQLRAHTVSGVGEDTDSLSVQLIGDGDLSSGVNAPAAEASVSSSARTVFSPHSDGQNSIGLTEVDWFEGNGLFSEDTFPAWDSNK